MRFLFLITHYKPVVYGAELFAAQLAEHLVSLGHQVDIVTGQWQPDWAEQETIKGVRVYRVPVLKIRYIQTLYFILPQFRQAQSLLDTNSYDIIHAHIFPSLVTGALLKTSAQKLVTIQGGDLADYPEIYGQGAPVLKKVIAWSLRRYQYIHCVSQDLAQQVKAMTSKKAVVIPNGVDKALLSQKLPKESDFKKFNLPQTKHLAYSPSRLTNKNNLSATIKAIKKLRDSGLDIGLAIAGEGHLEQRLQDQINQSGLAGSVTLLGRIDHQESLLLTQYADVLVRVSIQEGFGISLLEGLAVGTPVVTSLSGGLKDFISPDYAYVVTEITVSNIAQQIKQAIIDEHQPKKVGLAKAQVKRFYIWDQIFKQMLDLYQR